MAFSTFEKHSHYAPLSTSSSGFKEEWGGGGRYDRREGGKEGKRELGKEGRRGGGENCRR